MCQRCATTLIARIDECRLLGVPLVMRLPQDFSTLLQDRLHVYEWETYDGNRLVKEAKFSQVDLIALAVIIGGDYATGLFHETLGKNGHHAPPAHIVKACIELCKEPLVMFDKVSASDSLIDAYTSQVGSARSAALHQWGRAIHKKLSIKLSSAHEKTWRVCAVPPPSWPSAEALEMYLDAKTSLTTNPDSLDLWSHRGYPSIERTVEAMLDFMPSTLADVRSFLIAFEGSSLPSSPVPSASAGPSSQEGDGSAEGYERGLWYAIVASSVRHRIISNRAHGLVWAALMPGTRDTTTKWPRARLVSTGDDDQQTTWDVDDARSRLIDKLRAENVDVRLIERCKGRRVSINLDERVIALLKTPFPTEMPSGRRHALKRGR